MELRPLVVVVIAILSAQHSRACAPSCAAAFSVRNTQIVNKTFERVVVSSVEEAQWRGACHSFCINVS